MARAEASNQKWRYPFSDLAPYYTEYWNREEIFCLLNLNNGEKSVILLLKLISLKRTKKIILIILSTFSASTKKMRNFKIYRTSNKKIL